MRLRLEIIITSKESEGNKVEWLLVMVYIHIPSIKAIINSDGMVGNSMVGMIEHESSFRQQYNITRTIVWGWGCYNGRDT